MRHLLCKHFKISNIDNYRNSLHYSANQPSDNLTALDRTSVSDCKFRSRSAKRTESRTKSAAYCQPPRSLPSLPDVTFRHFCNCSTFSLAVSQSCASMLERMDPNNLSISDDGEEAVLGSSVPGATTTRDDEAPSPSVLEIRHVLLDALTCALLSRVATRAHSPHSHSL